MLLTMNETACADIGRLIWRQPGVKGGRPCIAGTGIPVKRIVGWHKSGMAPELIATEYSNVSLSQIHAALAYYYSNREEIDSDLADEASEYERLAQSSSNDETL
jgi:uncharacterized protein (DUF433 family)